MKWITLIVFSLAIFLYSDEFIGVYKSPETGYFGEIIELNNDGSYRYWMWSDFVSGNQPNYPVEGKYYQIEDTIVFIDREHAPQDMVFKVLDNKSILLTLENLDNLLENDLSLYGLLIQTEEYNKTQKTNSGNDSIDLHTYPKVLSKWYLKFQKQIDIKDYDAKYFDVSPSSGTGK